jgi:hypothetical protein
MNMDKEWNHLIEQMPKLLTELTSQSLRSSNDRGILPDLPPYGVIDRRYPLSEVPEALRYLEDGHAKGKLVITVDHNNKI